MFDLFSWSHILILLGVALVVVGPKDLPRLMHMMGRWAGKARGMANEFKRSFDEMARQSELDELRKEVEALRSNNALTDIKQSLNDAIPADMAAAAPVSDEPRAGEFQVTESPPVEAQPPPVSEQKLP
ncbi:MAG: twin-arginine translocase subunit TatB [Alphaproteobacteria bacterium]|nr:twin-arginine translocase subunit TatB [Alphaproteobacteria bacterium]